MDAPFTDSSFNNKETKLNNEKLAGQTMVLINRIERRQLYCALTKTVFLIWAVLFIPLSAHYLHYREDAGIARQALKVGVAQAEVAEMKLFGDDYLLNSNHSLMSYLKSWDLSFHRFHTEEGVPVEALLWFGVVGLLAAVMGSQMLKFYKIA